MARVPLIPVLHGLKGRATLECCLRQVMSIQPNVAHERAFEVFAASEVVAAQHLFDAAVEALDHAVGLRTPRTGQALLIASALAFVAVYVWLYAKLVRFRSPRWLRRRIP
jgi:hypothetical protein